MITSRLAALGISETEAATHSVAAPLRFNGHHLASPQSVTFNGFAKRCLQSDGGILATSSGMARYPSQGAHHEFFRYLRMAVLGRME
jgi:hypothetical protein